MHIQLVDGIDQLAITVPTPLDSSPATREGYLELLPRIGPTATVFLIYVTRQLRAHDLQRAFEVEAICIALGVRPAQLAKTLNRLERFELVNLHQGTGGVIVGFRPGVLR